MESVKDFLDRGERQISSRKPRNKPEQVQILETARAFLQNKGLALMVPITLFEAYVCLRSYSFYLDSLELKFLGAVSLALCVEAFYMYFSAKGGIKGNALKYMFLSVSVFTLAYNTFTHDENLRQIEERRVDSHKSIKGDIKEYSAAIKQLKNELSIYQRQMEKYTEQNYLTRGNNVLGPRIDKVRERISDLRSKKNKKNAALHKGLNRSKPLSLPRQLQLTTMKTKMMVVVFFLIQLSICFTLPDILNFPTKNN